MNYKERNKAMMLHFFFSFMLTAVSSEPPSPAPSPSIHDCSSLSYCGSIPIYYPFDISSDCLNYNDDNFSVTCDSSSGKPKLILTKLNLEVLEIRTAYSGSKGKLTVKVPTVDGCGSHDNTKNNLNLTLTPFFIDTTNNLFVSIGCDGNASLYDDKDELVGRCSSTCALPNHQQIAIDGCHSEYPNYYCCQRDLRSIPPLKSYRMQSIGRGSCRSAFLSGREFLASNVTLTMAITESAVPVVLGWGSDVLYPSGSDVKQVILIYILPPTVGALLLSSCCFWWCWLCRTRKRRKEVKLRAKYFKKKLKEQRSHNIELLQKAKLFSIKELKKATDNFDKDRILGEGGQGIVYKGMLTNGHIIAVKKSKAFDDSKWKEFINEVILLSQVTHRNIVKLFGICLETKVPILVYEFISNGTLSQHIHDAMKKALITWEIRIRIACEAAGAIAYLHSSSLIPIYHRDIKSTNILLDDEYHAKVTDFGISKAVALDQTHLTTCVRGTFGYLDPEYFETGQITEKSDVYSFGVILVELLTGQRPIRATTLDEERSLVDYFLLSKTESSVEEILDPMVLQRCMKDEVMVMVDVAERCLHPRGIERPTMHEVMIKLEGLRKKSSSAPIIQCQNTLEIESVIITRSDSVMENVYRSEIVNEEVDITYQSGDDELPLFCKTW